jgi:hypothetical protein
VLHIYAGFLKSVGEGILGRRLVHDEGKEGKEGRAGVLGRRGVVPARAR